MALRNRSYQLQYERLNSSKLNDTTNRIQHLSSDLENYVNQSSHNSSDVTDVEGISNSFHPTKRNYPNSFSDLSNTTNVIHPDASALPRQPSSLRQADSVGGGRYQRLLGSLNSSADGNMPKYERPLQHSAGPIPSQFDPLDKAFLQPQSMSSSHTHSHTPSARSVSAKGVLSARVVNDSEWKSIVAHPKTTRAGRARSVSPRKATASRSRSRSSPRQGSGSGGSCAATLSACIRNHAAGNNALDGAGKLQLVGCYMTELDALPATLALRARVLLLGNNSLSSLQGVQQFSNITTLSLVNNSLRYFHQLAPLGALPLLQRLALEGNLVTDMPFYRELVLGICCSAPPPSSPSTCYASSFSSARGLLVLDGVKVSAEERQGVRVKFRQACGQLDLMRCNELRVCVLEHVCALTACHSQLVAEVLGKFRHMLGAHIETSDQASGEVLLGRVLQVALAGGVFRWLQIGCGTNFENRVQDLALRMFCTATRRMTPASRHQLTSSPPQLTSFWSQLVAECLQHQQQVCGQLAFDCEAARDRVASAFSLRRSSEMRISGDKHPLLRGPHRCEREREKEKEGHQPLLCGAEGFGLEAWSVLQQLQFDDAGGLLGALGTRALTTQQTLSSAAASRHAWEVQVTYCGIGPHYSYPVADLLHASDVKAQQQFLADRRNLSLQHQQDDHQRKVAREEEQDRRAGQPQARPEAMQARYVQLLKSNLKKRVQAGKPAPPPPPPPVSSVAGGVASGRSGPAQRADSGVSGFASKSGGPPLGHQSSAADSVLTGDSDSSEHLGLGWAEFASDEGEDVEEGYDDESAAGGGGISLSTYNSHTRSRAASRSGSLVGSPVQGRHGENERVDEEDDEDEDRDEEAASSDSSSDSSTDSDMGSAHSEHSAQSGKSAKSGRSSKSAKSVRSVISMKSVDKDGEVMILKLTPDNLKKQHSEMIKLSQENLQRPNRFNLFKELGEAVQGSANVAAAGGSQNGYSIHDYMDEVRSYGRHTEAEAASELGSVFSTDEMYTSPALFLSKDHLEQERLLMQLLDSKKVREFVASTRALADRTLAEELPAWAGELWHVPGNLLSKTGASGASVVSDEAAAVLDVDSMSKGEVLALLLGPGGLGPEPLAWAAACTTAAAAPTMRQLTRLFEGASADYGAIQHSLKQVVQVRSVLQKQLTKVRNSLTADGMSASKHMEQLAIQVRKTAKANGKARDKWLMAVDALDDLFEIRQNISTGLSQDLEFEESALEVVEKEAQGLGARREGLLESGAEVQQALAAMQEDLRGDKSIREALLRHEASRRGLLFFLDPRHLQHSRRQAFSAFRRRVRRQRKIKHFFSEMQQVRRMEMMYTCMVKLKKFKLKQKRHRMAEAWLLRSRRERIWKLWRAQCLREAGSAALVQLQGRRRARASFQQWRLLFRRSASAASQQELLAARVRFFRHKWLFLKWRELARRNRIKGAVTDYSLDSLTLLKRARLFHSRKLFVGWKKVHLARLSDLLDREVVAASLSRQRLAEGAVARWCMSYTSCRHWKTRATSRVLDTFQRIASARGTTRLHRDMAEEFQQWRGLKGALLRLEGSCRRRAGLRARARAVREKGCWKLVVATYDRWRIAKNEVVTARAHTMKAMALYMQHVTRKAWKALLLFYWQSAAERQQRKLVQLQNLRFRSDVSLPSAQLLKTPAGFSTESRETVRRHREEALMRSHDALLAHPELLSIDMISSDEEEDQDQEQDRGLDDFAPSGGFEEGCVDWAAELSRALPGHSRPRRRELLVVPRPSPPLTRVKLKRMQLLDLGAPRHRPPCAPPPRVTRTPRRPPPSPAVHPLVQRLQCRQLWKRWFLASKRHARESQARRRVWRHTCLRTTRRYFNFLFHKWTLRCHKRMLAAHALHGTDTQFEDTIRDYNCKAEMQRAEIAALRLELDDAQVQLAAAHCESEQQAEQLARLHGQGKELQQAQGRADAERDQMQGQIRAVLLYCGGVPLPPSPPATADEALRMVAEQVSEEARPSIIRSELESTSAAGSASHGGGAPADNSLADIRARIERCAKAKHEVEQQIEEQHRATHGVHQRYAQEKHQLEQSQAGVRTVCAQYSVLLRELEAQAVGHNRQRHEAERVLRECSLALDMAMDTMRQKLDGLDEQHRALQEAQQQAEQVEALLREELQSLRARGDGQDRHRMEISPLGAMARAEVAACEYRVSSETALQLAEHAFHSQQRASAGALAAAATGKDRRNAGEEAALLAAQLVSQEQKESLNQGSLTRLHALRGGSGSSGERHRLRAEVQRSSARGLRGGEAMEARPHLSSSSGSGADEVASIADRIGLLSSRIRSRLGMAQAPAEVSAAVI